MAMHMHGQDRTIDKRVVQGLEMPHAKLIVTSQICNHACARVSLTLHSASVVAIYSPSFKLAH